MPQVPALPGPQPSTTLTDEPVGTVPVLALHKSAPPLARPRPTAEQHI